ncbi:MAG: hypothetical protein K2N51_09525 [Lachnospiraceae bacterium]|nr:hypothetical protein [Lachnospiraceae bacterium]
MKITKQDIKLMKFIKKNSPVTYQKVKKHFKQFKSLDDQLYLLTYNQYISLKDGLMNKYGEPKSFQDNSVFNITSNGIFEVEKHSFFDFEYFLSHILIPLLIGIIGSIVGAVFTALLA